MSKEIKIPICNLPYSLHDAVIDNIKIDNNNLYIHPKEGVFETKDPYDLIPAYISISNVDLEFSHVYIKNFIGETNIGRFTGEKISIHDFITSYQDYIVEAVFESYGYNAYTISGFLYKKSTDIIEFDFLIYYTGEIKYILS